MSVGSDVDEREELARFCAEALPELVGALAHHFGDRWFAQELAQEALIRACDRWSTVRGYVSPTGWAYHVGVNLGRSRLRRRRAERRALARRQLPAERGDASDVAAAVDLRRAMGLLSEPHREAVVLRYFLGLSSAEAAEVAGTTPGALRTRTSRALAVLREHLADIDVMEVADD